jgi:hypothetical protein
MPGGGTVPINITYNSQTQTYDVSPGNPHIDHGGTAQFNATNQACIIYFNPTTTVFGASLTVQTGSNQDISVGDGNFSVGYCVVAIGSSCTAPPPSQGITATSNGTIKVGSGSGMGHGKK